MIGREKEQLKLASIVNSDQAELVGCIGKRRIGKTYLLNEFFKKHKHYYYFTGQIGSKKSDSIKRCFQKLSFYSGKEQTGKTWDDFFFQLNKFISSKKLVVLVFDEVPWLEGKNIVSTGFKNSFAYHWNAYFSQKKDLKIFLTGSATSWMIEHILQDKGGLYGRVTNEIHLREDQKTFLCEAKLRLNQKYVLTKSDQLKFDDIDIKSQTGSVLNKS